MAKGFRNVPNQFEPLRVNRFELIFPNDLALANTSWMINMSDRPKMKVNSVAIPYMNTEQKVAGRATFEDLQLEFLDLQGPSSAQIILEWHRLCYENQTGRGGYAASYKKDLRLIALDPSLVGVQEFYIYGAFINNIDFGKNDYSSDDVQKISVTLSIDWADDIY
jgi:hypothetical protein